MVAPDRVASGIGESEHTVEGKSGIIDLSTDQTMKGHGFSLRSPQG